MCPQNFFHCLYLRLFYSMDKIFAYYTLREKKNGIFIVNILFISTLLGVDRHSTEPEDTVVDIMMAISLSL